MWTQKTEDLTEHPDWMPDQREKSATENSTVVGASEAVGGIVGGEVGKDLGGKIKDTRKSMFA